MVLESVNPVVFLVITVSGKRQINGERIGLKLREVCCRRESWTRGAGEMQVSPEVLPSGQNCGSFDRLGTKLTFGLAGIDFHA